MKALVVVPITMHNHSFSAPIGWLFSKNKEKVKGVYGFELTDNLIAEYDFFIVELNWFIELYEFSLIVGYIKRINPHARILFGGLYSALNYRDIFARFSVDYYIQGDNEEPMDRILNDEAVENVPNTVGRDFTNRITYRFTEDDFKNLEFDLDWFPSYFRYVDNRADYYMEDEKYGRLYEYNDQYNLPMLITFKGGCSVLHKGCDMCMGSKLDVLENIYGRPSIHMDNDTLLTLIKKIERKYSKASLFMGSNNRYDFRNLHFDIDMSIEIDANMPTDTIIDILHAFPRCTMNVGAYEEGISGSTIRRDYGKLLDAEDKMHRVSFFVYDKDMSLVDMPENRRLYSEDTFPKWAHWNFYSNYDMAFRFSRLFYSKVKKERRLGITI
jgi:hypothetical protein